MSLSTKPSDRVVLVADDDPTVRALVREALRPSGFEVDEASDGHRALAAFEERRPDLLLVDVVMPGLDGFDVCRHVRKNPANSELPVIMLTGLTDLASIRRAFACGATDFITKPVNWAILEQRVQYCIRAAEAHQALRTRGQRLAQAQRLAKVAYWESSGENFVVGCDFEAVFGIAADQVDGTTDRYLAYVHADDQDRLETTRREALAGGTPYTCEYRLSLPDGPERVVVEIAETTRPGSSPQLSGSIQDVSARREIQRRVEFLAHRDALTGLPNRRFFQDHFEKAIERARRSGTQLGCLFLDLDRFKNVNDTFGHSAGDELLRAAAVRLAGSLRDGDSVASAASDPTRPFISRFGGDEFIILLEQVDGTEGATAAANRVVEALQTPFRLQPAEVYISPSIGITLYPEDGESAETLIRKADSAMYAAKANGGAGHSLFSEAMADESRRSVSIESELRRGIERSEFRVFYQPRYTLDGTSTPRISGVEALVRWQHPERGLLLPGEFIGIAEETDLITTLGEWVVATSCEHLVKLRRETDRALKLAINVSARQLSDTRMPDRIRDLVVSAGHPVELVELEITEGILMADSTRACAHLEALREFGFGISLDDFGTGYSSLAYLKQFDLDYLKIDRSFIGTLAIDSDDARIVSAIITMAHGLGLVVVAEGVEESDQLEFLAAAGCDEVQGFLLSRPMPIDDLAALLRGNADLPRNQSSTPQSNIALLHRETDPVERTEKHLRRERHVA